MNTHTKLNLGLTEAVVEPTLADMHKYIEHQAIEVLGKDGKTHQLWARTAMDAFKDATKWSYRHGGLLDVYLLILQDEKEGCWDRAKRVPISRQCDLALIVAQNPSPVSQSATNYSKP